MKTRARLGTAEKIAVVACGLALLTSFIGLLGKRGIFPVHIDLYPVNIYRVVIYGAVAISVVLLESQRKSLRLLAGALLYVVAAVLLYCSGVFVASMIFPETVVPSSIISIFACVCLFFVLTNLYFRKSDAGIFAIRFADIAGFCTILFSGTGLLGYLYDSPLDYYLGSHVVYSLHSALVLFFLSVAVVAFDDRGAIRTLLESPDAGGYFLRRLLIPMLLLQVFLGWFSSRTAGSGELSSREIPILVVVAYAFIFALLTLDSARRLNEVDERRRKISDALSATNNSLENLLASLPLSFITLDFNWVTTYQNQAAEKYNQEGTTNLGKTLWENAPGLIGTDVERKLRSVMENRVVVRYEIYYELTKTWFDVVAYPTQDGIGIIFGDVTESKSALEALRESEAYFRALADEIPTIVWTARADGSFDFFNRYWTKFTGLVDKSDPFSVIHPDDRGEVLRVWQEGLYKGESIEIEYRIKEAGTFESYRWFLGRIVPIRKSDGTISRWFGTATDIHSHKALEHELEETVRHRTEFVSIASHELKSPVTSLRLQLQLLERTIKKSEEEGVSPKSVLKAVESSRAQVDRLSRLMEDLLDVSLIQSGKVALNLMDCALSTLLYNVLFSLRESISQAGCSVSMHIESDHVGSWDAAKIERIIANLITNAIKYGAGKPIRISIETDAERNFAFLSIHDEGIGVATADQKSIFERFGRAKNTIGYSGLGLGLYISRQLALAHGGSLEVKSELGQGSSFLLKLPLSSCAMVPFCPSDKIEDVKTHHFLSTN